LGSSSFAFLASLARMPVGREPGASLNPDSMFVS
jgi:hypothetical protein